MKQARLAIGSGIDQPDERGRRLYVVSSNNYRAKHYHWAYSRTEAIAKQIAAEDAAEKARCAPTFVQES